MTSAYSARQAEVPQSPLTSGSARFSRERGLAKACPRKLLEQGERRGAHAQQASSPELGREAVHVGVGDPDGGGAARIAPGRGVPSRAPPPALAPPPLAALKPAPRRPLVGRPLCALRLPGSPLSPLPALRYPRSPLGPPSVPAPGPRLARRSSGSPRLARSPRRRPPAPGLRGMGDHGVRPGRLMPMLALLSWAAGLGVAEETPSRIPKGELCTPASTCGSRGHVSSFERFIHAGPNRGAPCFAIDRDLLFCAPGRSFPSCLCLQAALGTWL